MKPDQEDKELSALFQKHSSDLRYQMPRELRMQLKEQFAPKQAQPSLNWFWGMGLAIMTCLALVLTFTLGRVSKGPDQDRLVQEIVSGHVRSLMVAHLSDVISTDRHTVKPWFEGRLDFGPDVKDFAQNGYPLIGGRLDYVDQRPVAALVYKSGQHVINLFEWPSSDATNAAPRFISQRGYHLFTWQNSGLQFWVVSDLNAADLQKFVEMWQ